MYDCEIENLIRLDYDRIFLPFRRLICPFQIPTTATVLSPTSRMDFKRLLLQQSAKTGPVRLSAAEQLKLSRQQQQQQQQQSSPSVHQSPLAKILSPRSVWRFQTPRTDVLSSTIIEDTAAEEKAMKPSPENTSPVSRLNFRRQLDLCNNLPNHLRTAADRENKPANPRNDRLTADKTSANEILRSELAVRSLNQNNRIREANANITTNDPNGRIASARDGWDTSPSRPRNIVSAAIQYSEDSALSKAKTKDLDPVSAFESRRLSNQLARAQFLAGNAAVSNDGQSRQNLYFGRQFRARSESPQHAASQKNVTRSPSAPTLETAL